MVTSMLHIWLEDCWRISSNLENGHEIYMMFIGTWVTFLIDIQAFRAYSVDFVVVIVEM